MIRELKSENERLKALLEGKIPVADGDDNEGDTSSMTEEEKNSELEILKRQIEENEREEEEMKKSYEDKLAAALANQSGHHGRDELLKKAKDTPHLTNLNMDPSLCRTIKVLIEKDGKTTIGAPSKADIGLYGIGILDSHGEIVRTGDSFTIDRHADAKILKNGRPVTSVTELCHLDRLVFGCSQYYLFINPSKASDKDPEVTFDTAQEEIGKASGTLAKDTKNMTQEEILCMKEMMDLLPSIEEANTISIALDKKVKFSAMAVSSASRGDYHKTAKVIMFYFIIFKISSFNKIR